MTARDNALALMPGGWDHPDPFVTAFAVAAADIDGFGHVNNAVYVRWINDCAWAHSGALGLDFARYRALDAGVVVIRHEIDYLSAAMPGETALVATWITANDGRLRLSRRFQLRDSASGRTLARAVTDFAAIALSTGRPRRMPDAFRTGYPVTWPQPGPTA